MSVLLVTYLSEFSFMQQGMAAHENNIKVAQFSVFSIKFLLKRRSSFKRIYNVHQYKRVDQL
jgi:hypothetical protein